MPEFAILSQTSYSILRLHSIGNRFALEEFHSEGRRAIELDEAEIKRLLMALPDRLLFEALQIATVAEAMQGPHIPVRVPSCDDNPFFDLDTTKEMT